MVAFQFEPGPTHLKQFHRQRTWGFILPITRRQFWELIRRLITSQVCQVVRSLETTSEEGVGWWAKRKNPRQAGRQAVIQGKHVTASS